MKLIKKTKEYTIFQKRNGRYAVQSTASKWVNGEEKAKILADEKLITLSAAAPASAEEEAPAEEAPAEEAAAE